MSAIPVAAAAPASIAVGRHQNCESEVVTPAIARVMPSRATALCAPKRTVSSQPAAPINAGIMRCHRRSRAASDARLIATIAMAPAALGSTVSMPIARGLATPDRWISVGIQKPAP